MRNNSRGMGSLKWFALLSGILFALGFHPGRAQEALSAYDQAVLTNFPVMYLTMGNARSAKEPDRSGHGHEATYQKAGKWLYSVSLPNGDLAARFNGIDQYLEVPDADALSIATTSALTIAAWIRPTELEFIKQQGSGYVHWLGKGTFLTAVDK